MIWFFRRNDEQLRCEIRRETEGEGYEFVVQAGGGPEQVQRFDDAAVLLQHSTSHFQRLVSEGWKVAGANPTTW